MGAIASKSKQNNNNNNADKFESANHLALTDSTVSPYDFAMKQSLVIKEKYDKKIESWITFFENAIMSAARKGFTEYKYTGNHYEIFSPEWNYFGRKIYMDHDVVMENRRTLVWKDSSKGLGQRAREIASNVQDTMYKHSIQQISNVIEKHACFDFDFIISIDKNWSTLVDRLNADGFQTHITRDGEKASYKVQVSWEKQSNDSDSSSGISQSQEMYNKTEARVKNLDQIQIIRDGIGDLYILIQTLARKKETFNSDKIIAGQYWISVLDLDDYYIDLHNNKSLSRFFVKEIIKQFVQEYPVIEQFKVKMIPEKCIALSWEI